jgi:alkanesulfonate monooxygenase SsuD/methylene tetrahydromethanopterin reductase-like flavin-dependent oxidoreductase (luciferase family)
MTLRVGVGEMPFTPHGIEFVRQAEQLGVDSVWAPEFWAGDALTPLAYLAACTTRVRLATGIVQLGARTPAMLAMSALSLQALSGVRSCSASVPAGLRSWRVGTASASTDLFAALARR